MNELEFAKYTLDNMARATLVNALSISDKFKGQQAYDLDTYIISLEKYICTYIKDNVFNAYQANQLFAAIYTYKSKIASNFNYNNAILLDDLIIAIWEAINGYQIT